MRDLDDFLDAGKGLDDARILGALRAGNADRCAMRAGYRMRLQPHLLDVADDGFDLFRLRAGLHDDEHARTPSVCPWNPLLSDRVAAEYNRPVIGLIPRYEKE